MTKFPLISIAEAKTKLLSGDVVAIPTETVYGLAGHIHSEAGLKKIFSTKERPFFDPLIVHVDSVEKARILSSDWNEVHDLLATSFWPGPLTMVVPKHSSVNPIITSGLDSVGIRCPYHKLTLDLLSQIEGGLAAPSANKFGKTSPTSAAHVFEEFGEAVSIIDGGPCHVGIESTVVGMVKEDKWKLKIYRPGHLSKKHFDELFMIHDLGIEVLYAQSPVAPGQLKHHYMPRIPLVLTTKDFSWEKDKGEIEVALKKQFNKPAFWKLSEDAVLASRSLYQNMREFDQDGSDIILLQKQDHFSTEEWLGIWNRLDKAKSLDLI
ncbi:MAG: L-threonylcarbamoyladenylate synthase [Bacteriovoracaceae bacterium]